MGAYTVKNKKCLTPIDTMFMTVKTQSRRRTLRGTKPSTRSLQAERTRKALFEKGCDILRNVSSVDDFAVEDITVACGVSKGTFYKHFKSKGAFFYNVKHALACGVNAELIELIQDTTGSAHESLLRFVHEWVSRFREFDLPLNEDFLAFVYDGNLAEMAPHEIDPKRFGHLIRAQIRAGVERGEFVADTPVDKVARLLVVTLTGFGVFIYAQKKDVDCSVWADEAVAMVDDGVFRRWLA